MTPIVGIEIEKDAQGQDAYIRIDLNKYGKQLESFLQEVGLNDDFENEWEKSLSKKELINDVTEYIKGLPWEK
jgi:hypothetical protein